jgi:hypothetical protein
MTIKGRLNRFDVSRTKGDNQGPPQEENVDTHKINRIIEFTQMEPHVNYAQPPGGGRGYAGYLFDQTAHQGQLSQRDQLINNARNFDYEKYNADNQHRDPRLQHQGEDYDPEKYDPVSLADKLELEQTHTAQTIDRQTLDDSNRKIATDQELQHLIISDIINSARSRNMKTETVNAINDLLGKLQPRRNQFDRTSNSLDFINTWRHYETHGTDEIKDTLSKAVNYIR